jgi:O-antigen ligase
MIKYFRYENIYSLLLLIWCISIPFKNAIYQASTLALIIYFIIYVFIFKDLYSLKIIYLKYQDLFLSFIFILLSMSISNIINDVSKTDAWHIEVMYIFRYALIFLILIYFYSKNFFSKKTLILYVFLSLSIQLLDGLYQNIFGSDFFYNQVSNDIPGALIGGVFHRNIFGFLMGIGVLISFIFLKNEITFKKEKFLYLIFLILFCYCSLLSYSRAIWLSLFIVGLIYILFSIKNIKLIYISYFIIGCFMIFLLFVNIESLNNRLGLLLEGNSAYRYDIWKKSIDLILEKPFFGWGIDSWGIIGLNEFAAVHNSILEILLCTGIMGFIFFSNIFIRTIKFIYINRNLDLFLILIYFFISSLFDQSIFESKILLSSLTIFMFYIYSIKIEDNEIEKKILNNV